MKRLFIAINIPQEIKEKIFTTYHRQIRKEGVKETGKNNLHITLKFLGPTSEEHINEIEQKLCKTNFEKFALTITGTGEFNGRTIWLGVDDKHKNAEKILGQINRLLFAGKGEKKFEPHITIARSKKPAKKEIKKITGQLLEIPFKEKFFVESIDLMESCLTQGEPAYTKIFQKKASRSDP
ncbi:MAG: RNA 2',3'-cyclic phosphodiesterase [archaeon]